ncbi:MAG TPA: hypothetical protein VF884_11295 [Nitrososphaeraceae archaeon]
MALINKKIWDGNTTGKWIFVGLAIAITIILVYSNNIDKVITFQFHNTQDAYKSKYFVPSITNESDNTILIKTTNSGWNTIASAEIPRRVYAEEPVIFIFDISDSAPTVHPVEITITGDKAQYLLFFPNLKNHKPDSKIQFEYTFSSPGMYNVDVTFGAPEGANININVEPNKI